MTFETECLAKRTAGARLTTLVKHYQKYNPLLDEQVCLVHVINILVSNELNVSKAEIYYCFKKNYNKDFHGDVQSYCKWLYSLLQPSKKIPYNSISIEKTPIKPHKLNETSQSKGKVRFGVKDDVELHFMIGRGDVVKGRMKDE